MVDQPFKYLATFHNVLQVVFESSTGLLVQGQSPSSNSPSG